MRDKDDLDQGGDTEERDGYPKSRNTEMVESTDLVTIGW